MDRLRQVIVMALGSVVVVAAMALAGAPCEEPELIGSGRTLADGLEASIAWNGDGFAVVWTAPAGPIETDIRFVLLDRSGRPIAEPHVVVANDFVNEQPALVWTGDGYGLALRTDPGPFTIKKIRFALLDGAGNVVSPASAIDLDDEDGEHPAIAWNGETFGVAWTSEGFNADALFRRIDADGAALGPIVEVSGVGIGNDERVMDMTWNPEEREFAVLWHRAFWGFFLTRVHALGNVEERHRLDTVSTETPNGFEDMGSIVWNGSEYALALTGCVEELLTDPRPCGLDFLLLSSTGEFLLQTRLWEPATSLPATPQIAWNGVEYAVMWQYHHDRPGTWLIRVDTAGEQIGNRVLMTQGHQWLGGPQLLWSDEGYVATIEPGTGLQDASVRIVRLGCNCHDLDADSISVCNDCDDLDATTFPGAPQLCDGRNNDCDDPNWPTRPADERDVDADGFLECSGDCSEGDSSTFPGAVEICDGVDNDCDGVTDEHAAVDSDDDGVGDICDVDDGLIYVLFGGESDAGWQPELGFEAWNLYRGDLAVLIRRGVYTQHPESGPVAARQCGLTLPTVFDDWVPGPDQVAFYLVAGVTAEGNEGEIGVGALERPNANPCPRVRRISPPTPSEL